MKAVQACQNLPGHQLICLLHRAPLAALTMNRPQIRLAFGCGCDLLFEAANDRHLAVSNLDQLLADCNVVNLHAETLNEPARKGKDIDRRIWFHAPFTPLRMPTMTASARLAELLAVEPDLHALMLATVRAWVERYAPEARFASLLIDRGEGMPMERHVVIPNASSLQPSPPLAS